MPCVQGLLDGSKLEQALSKPSSLKDMCWGPLNEMPLLALFSARDWGKIELYDIKIHLYAYTLQWQLLLNLTPQYHVPHLSLAYKKKPVPALTFFSAACLTGPGQLNPGCP